LPESRGTSNTITQLQPLQFHRIQSAVLLTKCADYYLGYIHALLAQIFKNGTHFSEFRDRTNSGLPWLELKQFSMLRRSLPKMVIRERKAEPVSKF